MRKLSIEGMVFYAPIGYYTKEQKIKNKISIDVHLFMEYNHTNKAIDQTINYEDIYTMVSEEVHKPAHLLEDVIQLIASRLKDFRKTFHPSVKLLKAQISISKINPALGGYVDRVTVEDEIIFDLN